MQGKYVGGGDPLGGPKRMERSAFVAIQAILRSYPQQPGGILSQGIDSQVLQALFLAVVFERILLSLQRRTGEDRGDLQRRARHTVLAYSTRHGLIGLIGSFAEAL